jgi:hypothetical protein
VNTWQTSNSCIYLFIYIIIACQTPLPKGKATIETV